ncbi:MAG: radical SAM protein [Syntrophaceae bacterium]|nr:radical SAM protein [Syntrophaceae bacterium]
MLLIHPPVSKPCEPPPGIARLCGALGAHGIGATVEDVNLKGLLRLMERVRDPSDTWTQRAVRNRARHLDFLRNPAGYPDFSAYERAILDLNRLIHVSGRSAGLNLSLGNFQSKFHSAIRSSDLIRAAEKPQESPFHSCFEEILPPLLEGKSGQTVGFSMNFLSQAVTTFAMVGFLRKKFSRLPIVLGGGLVTSWVRRPGWRDPFTGLVDSWVAGPGEAYLLSLLGKGSSAAEKQDIPNYEAFPLGDYLSPGLILPYSASSGCYWNRCRFCPEKAEGNPYRSAPAAQVLQDLEELTGRYRPVLIHLLDNALSPALLIELARNWRGVPWYGFTRITDHLGDLGFCRALKKSGCVLLQMGIESGDPGVLERLQKGIDLEVASRVLRNLKKAGIAAYVYLLFGTPEETEEGARKTLDFTVRHREEIGFLNLAIFNLPAYGEEAGRLATRDFYEGDLSLYWDFDHPRGWNRDAVRSFLDKEFKRHPAIAPILRRDPPIFTSNHAAFFVQSRRPVGSEKKLVNPFHL